MDGNALELPERGSDGRRIWLAHALTLSRIPLAIAFWLLYEHRAWAAAVVAVAALTDALDGTIARRVRRHAAIDARANTSRIGDWLDPVADKAFVLIALAAVVIHDHPARWIIALIAARELVLVPLAVAYRIMLFARHGTGRQFRAGRVGKAATVAQVIAVAALVLRSSWVTPLALVAAGLGLVAVGHYVVRTTRRIAGVPRRRNAPDQREVPPGSALLP